MSRAFTRRWLPDPEKLRSNPGLRWLRPLFNRPALWQVNRTSIALGIAIGIFFGLLAPIAQILFAGIAAFAAWIGELAEVAAPLFVGLATMAVAIAVLSYLLVQALWIAPVLLRAARRRKRSRTQES